MADKAAKPGIANAYDANLVKEYVDRAERIQDDTDALASDKKELFKEAKTKGLPVKALRRLLVERRAMEKQGSAYADLLETVDALRHALGDFSNSPLGKAAIAAVEIPDLPTELDRRRAEKASAT